MVPYETDEVTRLIIHTHDRTAFKLVSHLTVGGFRDWLLDIVARPEPGPIGGETRRHVPSGLGRVGSGGLSVELTSAGVN